MFKLTSNPKTQDSALVVKQKTDNMEEKLKDLKNRIDKHKSYIDKVYGK